MSVEIKLLTVEEFNSLENQNRDNAIIGYARYESINPFGTVESRRIIKLPEICHIEGIELKGSMTLDVVVEFDRSGKITKKSIRNSDGTLTEFK